MRTQSTLLPPSKKRRILEIHAEITWKVLEGVQSEVGAVMQKHVHDWGWNPEGWWCRVTNETVETVAVREGCCEESEEGGTFYRLKIAFKKEKYCKLSLSSLLHNKRLKALYDNGAYACFDGETDVDRFCIVLPTLQKAMVQGLCKTPPLCDVAEETYFPTTGETAQALSLKIRGFFCKKFGLSLPAKEPFYAILRYPYSGAEPWNELGFIIPASLLAFSLVPLFCADDKQALQDFKECMVAGCGDVLQH
eukprot:TRINITY_DN9559_c0_g1_i1.p1 TRINITY_DN9559_c0_g1~~TRINITY_DN9559_c0_g1_i1.p1  ORF type:complete len:274 (+),score=49.67 TRINITY_DN9559_c0_g1_i1:75-824(+)